MKRFLCLLFFTLLLCSCKVDYEKRLQKFRSNHWLLSMSMSSPATDTNHFVIWMEDGKVMYSELDNAEPTILLAPGDTMHLKYIAQYFFDVVPPIICDEDVIFKPESIESYDIKILNKKQFVLEDRETYGRYYLISVNDCQDDYKQGLRLNNIDVKNDAYLGKSIISTRITERFLNLFGMDRFYEYHYGEYDDVWREYIQFVDDYSFFDQMSTIATINEDMSIEYGGDFEFCNKKYQLSSLKSPETFDELYSIARRHYFERNAIPGLIKMATRYEVLDNTFKNKIQAEQDIHRGDRFVFKESFGSVEYSDNPRYKYMLYSGGGLRHTSFYLYTNEPIVAELSYPKFIYFIGTFIRHANEGEGYYYGILSDGIVLAYANDSDASPTQVVSHMFDEDYKGPHSRNIYYPDEPADKLFVCDGGLDDPGGSYYD